MDNAQADASPDRASPGWTDGYYTCRDGLRLHYRDYPGRSDRPPLLCLHGLTRNARDFEDLADHYAGDWRVIALDFRGRGDSDPDPQTDRYVPPSYAGDVIELLDGLGIPRAIFIGTSLGGLVTMVIATFAPDRIAGVVLNDTGPELSDVGIDRIREYVGKGDLFANWDDAAARLADRHGNVHPAYGPDDWQRYARRVCRETERGIELDYDMAIAEPFTSGQTGVVADAWPFYRALAGRPILVLRGETSDLLAADALVRMDRELDDAEVVTIPGVGHAPDLSEPESIAAIDRLLARVLDRA